MVRLKDIAQRAGVSVMTVSKVIRDAPDISAATKARVRALAQEMGYVPDSVARGLRTRATRLLGLIIPAITNPVFARMVLAIEEQAHAAGYDLLLAHTLNVAEREELVIRRLLSRRVEGLLIFPVYRLEPAAPIYHELKRSGVPTVILGPGSAFCSQFIHVQADDTAGSATATRHLLELGHRRIAFFAGPRASPWAQERFDGYRRALREGGLELDDHLVFQAGGTLEEGTRAALQLLQEGPDATAVQAVNDMVAIGAANVFLNQGLRIPADLSIVGFGNVLTSAHFRVPLTTVRQPKYRMGAAAVEALFRLIRGEPAESQRLSVELLVRASTGVPPSAAPVAGHRVVKRDN